MDFLYLTFIVHFLRPFAVHLLFDAFPPVHWQKNKHLGGIELLFILWVINILRCSSLIWNCLTINYFPFLFQAARTLRCKPNYMLREEAQESIPLNMKLLKRRKSASMFCHQATLLLVIFLLSHLALASEDNVTTENEDFYRCVPGMDSPGGK